MLVKCRACQQKIDRDTAFRLVVKGRNHYYCSKQEYDNIQYQKELKSNTYLKIYDIFGRKVTNTILFKEINELVEVYGYEKIYGYLSENHKYLSNVMSKQFNNEYAQIRYFSAILKNSLADFKLVKQEEKREIKVDMVNSKYKPRQRKKTLVELEMEVGDLL